MLVFNNYFCKNRKSKLHFGDRVAVLKVFLYQTGGNSSVCVEKKREQGGSDAEMGCNAEQTLLAMSCCRANK
jgi:phosphoketolase